MKRKCLISLMLLAAVSMAACGKAEKETDTGAESSDGEVKEFTAFFAVPGSEINDDNEIQQKIAEITGAKCKETWLTGQTAQEAVGTLIAGGEYPDMIDGGDGMAQLYDAGALVALDDYIDKYPNIKEYLTEEQWDKLRQDDGHIYWIQQFGNIYGEEKATTHNDEAFWIQARVLEWAVIKCLVSQKQSIAVRINKIGNITNLSKKSVKILFFQKFQIFITCLCTFRGLQGLRFFYVQLWFYFPVIILI